jgi:hypothetical protein
MDRSRWWLIMRIWRLTVLCSLLFLIRPFACSCSCLHPTAKEASGNANVVFRGKLVKHKGGFAVFRISEQWKGNLGADVEFEWRDGSHGDCSGFWPKCLKVGNELLVFATGADGIYRTSICWPTKFVLRLKQNSKNSDRAILRAVLRRQRSIHSDSSSDRFLDFASPAAG